MQTRSQTDAVISPSGLLSCAADDRVSAHCTRAASSAWTHLTDRVKLSEPYYNDLSAWSKAPTRSHESAYK